ncbi:hypothetical protein G6F51_014577 [Rhizopus arrhizus]|uniref:Uncharacterized protein n=1 Tax=Rhizopus oryzae TaxID=64495 RepID=A0A9P6XLD4_RHIOR|nr:hypothetical protein G6F51_014577 [Rhizopus arrhizus]
MPCRLCAHQGWHPPRQISVPTKAGTHQGVSPSSSWSGQSHRPAAAAVRCWKAAHAPASRSPHGNRPHPRSCGTPRRNARNPHGRACAVRSSRTRRP